MPRFQILAAACAGLLAACAGQPTSPTSDTSETVASTPVVTPPVVRATARVTDIAGVEEDATPSYDNVWARMLANFELEGCAEHATSVQWTRWYGSRPDYMERVVARAEPWIHFIVEELERRGLPGELALLPIVESAYDPFAYSRGRALGTWQSIAETGRRFGLQQDWWYDGRRDV
ncbi:MAG: transglycosylase SLT domain-containing protein, partial [Xanthomonadales bacterium]|nr:transglycosylase SLT domain-containing protein [Xanthomonadales bacterium]